MLCTTFNRVILTRLPMSAAVCAKPATEAPETAADTVFHGIVQALSQQRLVPGQRLLEVDPAAQFGVSRASVREALQRLSAHCLIELFRHKGATITPLSAQDPLDVCAVHERTTGPP